MKLLETFNTTLNDVVSKLKQNVNTSTPLDSEDLSARNIKDVQTETGSFFQNLGKNLDNLIFQVTPLKPNTVVEYTEVKEHSAPSIENPVSKEHHSVSSVENTNSKEEHSVASVENPVSKEHFTAVVENPVSKDGNSVDNVQNPFIKNERSATKAEHPVTKLSTNDAIMFSSIF